MSNSKSNGPQSMTSSGSGPDLELVAMMMQIMVWCKTKLGLIKVNLWKIMKMKKILALLTMLLMIQTSYL